MAIYRKIAKTTWGDRKFCELSRPQPNAQSLWLWLLLGPRTIAIPGVIEGRLASLAADLDWPEDRFLACFQELEDRGMAIHDASIVYLPNAWRQEHNWPENPNVLKGWANPFWNLPETPLRDRIWSDLKRLAEACDQRNAEPAKTPGGEGSKPFARPFAKAFAERFLRGSRKQETGNREQETTTGGNPSSCTEPPADARRSAQATASQEGVLLTFPVVGRGGPTWDLTLSMLAKLSEAYPGIDAEREARSAHSWCETNPGRRKTARGMSRFLDSWMRRQQERGGSKRDPSEPAGYAGLREWAKGKVSHERS